MHAEDTSGDSKYLLNDKSEMITEQLLTHPLQIRYHFEILREIRLAHTRTWPNISWLLMTICFPLSLSMHMNFKQVTAVSLQLFTCSSFMIFPSHSTLHSLRSWNSVVRNFDSQPIHHPDAWSCSDVCKKESSNMVNVIRHRKRAILCDCYYVAITLLQTKFRKTRV